MGARQSKVERIYRLTPTQEGILFHVLQSADPGLYLQQFTCVLRGALDVTAFQSAWNAALARHAAARTVFTWEGREHPLQVVLRKVDVPIEVLDDEAAFERGDALDALLAADRSAGLRLDEAPLMRVRLIRGGPSSHRLVWTFHHALFDGWSMRLFLRDALAASSPRGTAGRFEDYIAWLGRRDDAGAYEHWRRTLAGFDAPTGLGLEPPRDAEPGPGPSEVHASLSRAATRALVETAREGRVTLNVMLRAAWALVLAAYSGVDDVVFGSTVSGRPADLEGVEGTVGMFISTIPVRVRIDRSSSVASWLRTLHGDQLAASEFDFASLARIQRESDLPAGEALFETILVFENHALELEDSSEIAVVDQRFVEQSHFPLALLVLPGDELALTWVFQSDRFDRRAIERVSASVVHVLEALGGDPERRVGSVDVLAPDELTEIRELSAGPSPPPFAPTIIDAFESAAGRSPDAAALVGDERTVSYAELEQSVRSLASAVVARGCRKGERVALLTERGTSMVVAIFGVLRAGAAYVPLSPDDPPERIASLVAESKVRLVVTTERLAATLPEAAPDVLSIEDVTASGGPRVPGEPPAPDDTAYVLFTSGSTGRPKGVEVTHANLAASTAARPAFYGEPCTRFLLLSPYHFDSSVVGIFWPLSIGGALVLAPVGAERDVHGIAAMIARHEITHLLALPSLWEAVLDVAEPDQLRSLRTVIVAGEACPRSLVDRHRRVAPNSRIVNEYGPTEATVWATAHVASDDVDSGRVPIGRPVAGASTFLVDQRGRAVPFGVPGEIAIAGAGVARGYLGRPLESDERFVELSPFGGPGEKAFRTGDLARYRPGGALEFLGRGDDQVKIRGHRVELGEVEARLLDVEGVREAAVVARARAEGGQTELVAYVVGADGLTGESVPSLRSRMAAVLPPAMVPSVFVLIDALPRTSTGKVDRRALPAPVSAERGRPAEAAGRPLDEVESTLAELWRDVLGVDHVEPSSNFFELGGDSLSSIRVIARAHRAGMRVDASRFADDSTLAGMAAAVVRTDVDVRDRDSGDSDDSGEIPLTAIQRWFFSLDLPERAHWNLTALVPVPREVSATTLERALSVVLGAHEALRTSFVRSEIGWRQVRGRVPTAASVDLDLAAIPASERAGERERRASELHRSLDLENGPLVRTMRIRAVDGTTDELLVIAHHLVVDAVSLGTITEDIERAVDRLGRGLDADLPPAVPFGRWARRLESLARSDAMDAELSYWTDLLRGAVELPLDGSRERRASSTTDEDFSVIAVDAATTEALLREAPAAYAARALDLLLTALGRVLGRWAGLESIVIDLERHGREGERVGLEPSRIVGWLTAVAPIAIGTHADDDLGTAIKSVKESLRAQPFGGIGFGLVEDRLSTAPRRDLLFNYLGRASLPPSTSAVGQARSHRGERGYLIEVNAAIDDGELQIRWAYAHSHHRTETIEALAADFVREIEAIVEHCADASAGGRTPSDFPLAGLDQAALDRLSDRLSD
ncbi:MAG: amino acid adenylation domain-containing protein [Planctomycetota bacterium]